jgi:hypothetical protein
MLRDTKFRFAFCCALIGVILLKERSDYRNLNLRSRKSAQSA